ncbi:Gfo/Idh/MocA family protein [Histidinibacterium lentulum]|uniref:Gfo/Idh/MocA family oxidoreductase n=1 Tax=Histidinibacterium lentulum TaxID=2480588 RepID=A0A3N2R5A7_9RHOB|nr:Gfo/Idh/MocA family oxidoreductase [Histidinibacterium lentulum]ROU02583.1 gfo/Idh/MocA family oxidoreductase [Histidinibacterium lentulum]
MSEVDTDTYALKAAELPEIDAPPIDYRPPAPKSYRPRIALIGAGGISASHLDAYRTAGWDVVAIANRTLRKAEDKAAKYYPEAVTTDDWRALLADPTIDVVDITPYPQARLPIIEAALEAGKHVLSQKPFVTRLEDGERLVKLADEKGVKLAINQNGRWSPHMAWIRQAVRAGLIGDLISVHCNIAWNHGWIEGTDFEKIDDLILYDFGVHWFDFVTSLAPGRVQSVVASSTRAIGQTARPPLLAQALVRLDGAQASLVFDGAAPHGPHDHTYVVGTKGSLVSLGADLGTQSVTLTTAEGRATPVLEGTWFNDGFRGAMGELLCAIEEDREPVNGARENLQSLALTFAAIASDKGGREMKLGEVREMLGATP